ncbi:MAG: M64 family metallopeptidase, partial [Bacteroidota bacterium]
MKKALLFCCLCLGQMSLSAQIFEVDTIQYSGAEDKRINIVFLGDGYQSQELNQYRQDVNSTVEEIFVTSPFQEYRDYFNVFAILVPSVESGASHPGNAFDEPSGSNHPVSSVNNYFGSTFD